MAESTNKITRYYWDSCVFLSYIEGHKDRSPVIEENLTSCEAKQIEIWTSHFSIAEVAFAKAEKDGRALDEDVESAIDQLWHPDSVIRLVEVSQLICVGARKLLREMMAKNSRLQAADAIHLATAKTIGADSFHTYDEALCKCGKLLGMNMGEPPITASLFSAQKEPDGGAASP